MNGFCVVLLKHKRIIYPSTSILSAFFCLFLKPLSLSQVDARSGLFQGVRLCSRTFHRLWPQNGKLFLQGCVSRPTMWTRYKKHVYSLTGMKWLRFVFGYIFKPNAEQRRGRITFSAVLKVLNMNKYVSSCSNASLMWATKGSLAVSLQYSFSILVCRRRRV